MKAASLLIVLLGCAIAINLRSSDSEYESFSRLESDVNVAELENDFKMLVAQPTEGCVTVFAECNFEGNSANVCSGDMASVSFPIASVRAPQGFGISIQIGSVAINLIGSITCIQEPLNQQRQSVSVSVIRPQ